MQCSNGHSLEAENVYIYGTGQIVCRTCRLTVEAKRREDPSVRLAAKERSKTWRINTENKLKTFSRRQEVLAYIRSQRTECLECGESHLACLDFHHRDPSLKKFALNVSIIGNRSLESVKEEIAKCDVLCANCHRKRHYTEKSKCNM